MTVKFKKNCLILPQKQTVTKTKEFIASTKMSAKINQKILALGGKIKLYYWDKNPHNSETNFF